MTLSFDVFVNCVNQFQYLKIIVTENNDLCVLGTLSLT
jgi:hypothetical protein